ncbi:hypothetical protein [Endozoicomonas sp.]|uniref:hypothetical protein n=1 Tax=Endozoicomonas sp. TaxID=1892382 RepID=UPI003AF65E4A
MSILSGVADYAQSAASSTWSVTKNLAKTGAVMASGLTEVTMSPGRFVASFAGHTVGYAIGTTVGIFKAIKSDSSPHTEMKRSIRDWKISASKFINSPLSNNIPSIGKCLGICSALALTGAAASSLGLPAATRTAVIVVANLPTFHPMPEYWR